MELMPTPTAAVAYIPFGVVKVGKSHGWSWFVGAYDHSRVYPTKREAIVAMHAYIEDQRAARA